MFNKPTARFYLGKGSPTLNLVSFWLTDILPTRRFVDTATASSFSRCVDQMIVGKVLFGSKTWHRMFLEGSKAVFLVMCDTSMNEL
jgi:hypothetical protein